LAKQYADATIAGAAAQGVTLNSAAATPFAAANFYSNTGTTNPYRKMWADLSQGEVIFSLFRGTGNETINSIFTLITPIYQEVVSMIWEERCLI